MHTTNNSRDVRYPLRTDAGTICGVRRASGAVGRGASVGRVWPSLRIPWSKPVNKLGGLS